MLAAPLPEASALLPDPSHYRRNSQVSAAGDFGARRLETLCELRAFALAPDAVGAVILAVLQLATDVMSTSHRLRS
jgi:hypothetical protein